MIGEYSGAGVTKKTYGWPPNGIWGTNPLFLTENANYHFYHNDHLGTPQTLTDVNGDIVWDAIYEAFGRADIDPISTITNNLRFPGQYWDNETGLHWNWQRYYDSQGGRYIERDPIGIVAGNNAYYYADNNPNLYMDFMGLSSCTYSISRHTLVCKSNDGKRGNSLGPDGVFSGLEECKDNASEKCQKSSFSGPIVIGNYKIHSDDREKNKYKLYWRLESDPPVSAWEYYSGKKRSGFMLHPGARSLGCITIDITNREAIKKYNVINDMLKMDKAKNTLRVYP